MSMIFSQQSYSEAAPELLTALRHELDRWPNYVLWLKGEMGAGKTSLVRAYLYQLGLASHTPVVSPTYTIMNEYRIGPDWYAHLDFYRADAQFSLDELGVRDLRPYRGIFVEWPEQGGPKQLLDATHILSIDADGWDRRFYALERISN